MGAEAYQDHESLKMNISYVLLSDIAVLPERIEQLMTRRCATYFFDKPKYGEKHFMNHCAVCKVSFADDLLYGADGYAFSPEMESHCEGITMTELPEDEVLTLTTLTPDFAWSGYYDLIWAGAKRERLESY